MLHHEGDEGIHLTVRIVGRAFFDPFVRFLVVVFFFEISEELEPAGESGLFVPFFGFGQMSILGATQDEFWGDIVAFAIWAPSQFEFWVQHKVSRLVLPTAKIVDFNGS
jgi:hypothetical protein